MVTYSSRIITLALVVAFTCSASPTMAVTITGFLAPSGSVPDSLGGIGGMLDVYTIVADNSIGAGGTGTNITAFDISIFGTFAQVQNATFGTNSPSPLRADIAPFGAAAVAQDTHFLPNLVLPGPPIPAPTEGVITAGVPASGLADNLISNQVAIAGPDQAPTVAIAQLVLSDHFICPFTHFEGTIAIAGNPDPIPVSALCMPEPTSAVLALFAACLPLRRRRV